ncbi:restriction endonuclease [bacterium]|nr:restriction endonuclease [bacterium]
MSIKMWMVRAGRAAYLVDEFIEKKCVAIGWNELGDLAEIDGKEKIKELYRSVYPGKSQGKQQMSIGQIYRFRSEIKVGDSVITYNPEKRIYHIGEIKSDYKYKSNQIKDYNHIREVSWKGEVERDILSVSTKNTIGAIMTLFLLNNNATKEFLELLKGNKIKKDEISPEEPEIAVLRDDVIEQGYEFIKDKILTLDWEEMQELVAGILRAMGYKTRVSARGADRGVDVIASPDGLGLEQPRIKVEVKHRAGTIGSNQLRSFIGGLTSSDRGLYVSTGGFSKDARYEAERSNIPITLIDIDSLTELLIENYDKVDNDIMTLIPLKKLYWPA